MTDPSLHSWSETIQPELVEHGAPEEQQRLLVWRLPEPVLVISSAPLGGGIGRRDWVINVQVPHGYARLDPEPRLGGFATRRELSGPGVGMLTAVDLRQLWSNEDGGARADVSVGVTVPTWAAAPDEPTQQSWSGPGTINIVGVVPERLSSAAMVNAAMTVTEAKAQALWDAGVAATGTASDAVCIVCPDRGVAQPFGGPRSQWGARLARAVYRAVTAGCRGASES